MNNFTKIDINTLIEQETLKNNFLYDVEDIEFRLIENLVTERKKKKLTQQEISKITGMSQQAISRIEKYGNKPSLKNLIKYIKALDIDINVIFN